jgi:hypothetical protein
LAWPLNDLTKKDKKFEWTNECQNAFDTLKKNFTEELVLMIPDHSKTIPNRIRCIQSSNRSSLNPIIFQRWSTPMLIYFQSDRTELQNIRLGTTRNNSSTRRMETLY